MLREQTPRSHSAHKWRALRFAIRSLHPLLSGLFPIRSRYVGFVDFISQRALPLADDKTLLPGPTYVDDIAGSQFVLLGPWSFMYRVANLLPAPASY
jgi:hypothetical protein